MKLKLIILFLFSFIRPRTDKPSIWIWEEASNAIKNKQMIVPEDKTRFIFDQKNYLKEEINSTKMEMLYEKQDNVYNKTGIQNYIFFVDNIDENEEDLETCAKKISNFISYDFNISVEKSIIVLFSMESRRIRIQPGTELSNNFSETVSTEMINHLGDYMRSEDYYGAIEKLLEDIIYYNNESQTDYLSNIIGIIFMVIIFGSCCLYICCCPSSGDSVGCGSFGGGCGGGGGGGGASGGW